MKNLRILSENFQFLEMNFSIYLNRRVSEMVCVILLGLSFMKISRKSSIHGKKHFKTSDTSLMLSTLGKIFSRRHMEIFFSDFLPEKGF